MGSKRFKKILEQTPAETRRFMKTSVEIIDQIHMELTRKGWKQADLAKKLGKQESEVSKWLTPGHNFTLKSLAKIEAVLGVSVLKTVTAWKAASFVSAHPRVSSAEAYRSVRALEERPRAGAGKLLTVTFPAGLDEGMEDVARAPSLDKFGGRSVVATYCGSLLTVHEQDQFLTTG